LGQGHRGYVDRPGDDVNNLTRRRFLQLLGVSAAAVAFRPTLLVAEENHWDEFDPNVQYGTYRAITEDIKGEDDPLVRYAVRLLDEDIKAIVPPKYRRHISWIIQGRQWYEGEPLTHFSTVAWKYTPPGMKYERKSLQVPA
jgi:hypothetical protein